MPEPKKLAKPKTRSASEGVVLEAIKGSKGSFDVDLFHVMDKHDDALVAQDVIHGAMSAAFVYNFKISGSQVSGVSVIGAAHLARKYGGLKHRLVASTEKRGGLFTFTSYPSDVSPMQVTASFLDEMKDDPDFYKALIEVTDIKTGNSVQMERMELREETRKDKTKYDRPNFQTIAQSKAYRNAVLRLVPQEVILEFKKECISLGQSVDVTESAIEKKRESVIGHAVKLGIAFQRAAVMDLGWDEISGLGEAARESQAAFVNAAKGLGLIAADAAPAIEGKVDKETPAPAATAKPKAAPKKATPPKKPAPEKEPEQSSGGPQKPEGEPIDPETGEVGTAAPAPEQEAGPATEDPGAQRAEDPGPPEDDNQGDWGDFTD